MQHRKICRRFDESLRRKVAVKLDKQMLGEFKKFYYQKNTDMMNH